MTEPANHSDKIFQSDVRIVEISREPVELYKILKFEGMVGSGGQAKTVVAAGQVLVNGKVETRKGKKIVTGDTIEFNNEKIGIKLA
jgi:ribosome-associated protein